MPNQNGGSEMLKYFILQEEGELEYFTERSAVNSP